MGLDLQRKKRSRQTTQLAMLIEWFLAKKTMINLKMARGSAETCCQEKLCNKNIKQVVFDCILPVYFVILCNTTGMSHLKGLKVRYHAYKSLQLFLILSHMNPVYVFPYFLPYFYGTFYYYPPILPPVFPT